jgi:hypothetical protein
MQINHNYRKYRNYFCPHHEGKGLPESKINSDLRAVIFKTAPFLFDKFIILNTIYSAPKHLFVLAVSNIKGGYIVESKKEQVKEEPIFSAVIYYPSNAKRIKTSSGDKESPSVLRTINKFITAEKECELTLRSEYTKTVLVRRKGEVFIQR